MHGAGTAEHVARFEIGGVYNPVGLAQYLVVDFRVGANPTTMARNACNNLKVVHFSTTFETCTVQRDGQCAVMLCLKT